MNSLMYVLSVCTALQYPAPTADTALTLTLYSVPAARFSMVVVWGGGEPKMMCWLPQEVVPCILYWRWYWEMGSSLCGVVQVACRAGNFDDTVLDRDRPVTWEGVLPAFGSGQNTIWIRFYLFILVYTSVYGVYSIIISQGYMHHPLCCQDSWL